MYIRNKISPITFDFSGVEAQLEFLSRSDVCDWRLAEKVAGSQGMQRFLWHHRHQFDKDQFKKELVSLKRGTVEPVRWLTGWPKIIPHIDRLKETIDALKVDETAIIREIAEKIYEWLPVVYMRDRIIYILLDGMSSGYSIGKDFVCDLFPMNTHDNPVDGQVLPQIFKALYFQELKDYLNQIWFRYGERFESESDYYRIRVLLELMKGGIPHYLGEFTGMFDHGLNPDAQFPDLPELAGMYNNLIDFAASLETSNNPGEIFNRDIGRFYEGRYSTFQILGAFMCDQIVKQLGNTALLHCVTNPLEFHEQFEVSLNHHPDRALFEGNSFSSIFSERERRAQPPRKAKRTIVKCLDNGARIIAIERQAETSFCLLFKGAGSLADYAGAGGLAHLVEHQVINRIRKGDRNIIYLKGLTDYVDCRYLGTINADDDKRLGDLLEETLQPLPDADDEFKEARREVTAELEFVSRNPFYLTENMLMRMMVPGTSAIRGDISELSLLRPEDSILYHRRHYRPSKSVLAIQAADPERLMERLSFIGDWPEIPDDICPVTDNPKIEDSNERCGWIKCPYPIATCSLGFKVDSTLAFEIVSDYIIKRLIDQSLKWHLREIVHEKKAAIISGYKCMGTYGVLTVGIQARDSDIVKVMDHVMDYLSRIDLSSDVTQLSHNEDFVEALIERICCDSHHGLLELAAKNSTEDGLLHQYNGCNLRDFLNVKCRDFGESLARAINPDSMWMTGIGPTEVKRF